MDDIRDIKRRMVKGSTKLIFDDSDSAKYVKSFDSIQNVANMIGGALKDRNWGWDYPRMIREYFGDIYLTLLEIQKVLKEGKYALLVVGDQTYKNILIPVGQIICELANDLKFAWTGLETLRIRRSTMHSIPLKEEIVVLKK